ncbi:MAG TPA: DUF3224 domain-containing protein [Kofleriaceae bacterium]|nr:DUF3224 domain-containing protein [Kofleriaceae bacterium]
MSTRATGAFEVTLTPQPADDPNTGIGRLIIAKHLRGDLEGTSEGVMLAFRTPVDGSAGYVAMERVTGALHGRRGSFALQHSGTSTRGALQLSITVVPDSGTDELAGLSGRMQIIVDGGAHTYELDYTIEEPG